LDQKHQYLNFCGIKIFASKKQNHKETPKREFCRTPEKANSQCFMSLLHKFKQTLYLLCYIILSFSIFKRKNSGEKTHDCFLLQADGVIITRQILFE